jgi:hypothetical protein
VERDFFLARKPEYLALLTAEGIHSKRVGKQDRIFGIPWIGFVDLPIRPSYRTWCIPVAWAFPPAAVTVAASVSVTVSSAPEPVAVEHGSDASATGPGPPASAPDAPLFADDPWLDTDSTDSDSCDEIGGPFKASVPVVVVAGASDVRAGKRKRCD